MKSLKVVLGTMTWGRNAQTSKDDALKQIRILTKFGHSIALDTARMYQAGQTEQLIGEILSENPDLDVEIHTKATPDFGGLGANSIKAQMEGSLHDLKQSYINLYYLHLPDLSTALEESLEAISELHQQQKFKRFGICNYPSWEVVRINWLCEKYGFIRPTVYQGPYNMIARAIEPELLPAVRSMEMSFYAYNPLAGGLLSGKYASAKDVD